ncbi:MAG: regulatory protein RecX [Clostridia bacterium]|nr:regulatory protein RecX [Clostridia bacterium]
MFLLGLVISDRDVFVTIGNDDGREEFVVSPNRWKKLAAAFGIGEVEEPLPVNAGFYDAVSDAAGATRALRDGAKVLSGGPKSRRELIHKLCDRGSTRAHAEEAADYLEKRGYLNEREQAETLARSLLRRNRYGKLRIRAYLGSHGYGAAAVNEALSNISPVDWREGCMTLIERKYTPWPADMDGQKKAYAALARLGYTAEEVKTALKCCRG